MGRKVSKITQVIEEPDSRADKEIYGPEQGHNTYGSENYKNRFDSYLPRSSSPDNPF